MSEPAKGNMGMKYPIVRRLVPLIYQDRTYRPGYQHTKPPMHTPFYPATAAARKCAHHAEWWTTKGL